MNAFKSFTSILASLAVISFSSLALIEAEVTVIVTRLQGRPIPTQRYHHNGDCYCP